MNSRVVRRETTQARHTETGATAALVFVFVGMVALGVIATVHAMYAIVTDALNGVF